MSFSNFVIRCSNSFLVVFRPIKSYKLSIFKVSFEFISILYSMSSKFLLSFSVKFVPYPTFEIWSIKISGFVFNYMNYRGI